MQRTVWLHDISMNRNDRNDRNDRNNMNNRNNRNNRNRNDRNNRNHRNNNNDRNDIINLNGKRQQPPDLLSLVPKLSICRELC